MRAVLLLTMVLVMGACAANTPGRSSTILPSLQATAVGDSVHFVLQVTNTSESPLTLRYRSGQSFDFAVMHGAIEVWRWSEEMVFTQALRQERLEAGETLSFHATWRPPVGLEGELLAVARLTSDNHPVEQRAHFRLP